MDTIHLAQMENDLIVEGPSLITMNPGQNPENAKPFLNEQFSNNNRFLTAGNKSLAEFRKGISENKNFSFPPFEGSALVKSIQSNSSG